MGSRGSSDPDVKRPMDEEPQQGLTHIHQAGYRGLEITALQVSTVE